MSPHLLDMRGIQKSFGQVKALTSVNLQVGKGEIHAICGENGAGKSTLMKNPEWCLSCRKLRRVDKV